MIQMESIIDFKYRVVERKLCSITVEVEVVESDVSYEIKYAFNRIQQGAKIDGFRQGKVPMNVLYQKFSIEANNMAAESIIKKTLFKVLEKESFRSVCSRVVEEFGCKFGQIFKYRFIAECHPKINLKEYKDIFIAKEVFKITDEILSMNLDALREKNAKLVPSKSNKITAKNLVVIDYDGFDTDGNALPEISAKGYLLDLGYEKTPEGFKEALVGANIGDKKDVKIDYPAGYPDSIFKGKTIIFKIKIIEIKEKELPKLDDAFAKSVGTENLMDLKAKMREIIENNEKHRQNLEMKKQISDYLLEKNDFEVPDFVIKEQMGEVVGEKVKYMRDRNFSREQIEKQIKLESVKLREEAEKSVKLFYILDAIYCDENLNVGFEDIEIEKSKTKISNPGKEIEIDKYFVENRKGIMISLKEKKTFEFLLDNAKIEISEKDMPLKKSTMLRRLHE